jgi:hypothetical protein
LSPYAITPPECSSGVSASPRASVKRSSASYTSSVRRSNGSTTASIRLFGPRSSVVVRASEVPYACVSLVATPFAANVTRRTLPFGWVTRVSVTRPVSGESV